MIPNEVMAHRDGEVMIDRAAAILELCEVCRDYGYWRQAARQHWRRGTGGGSTAP